MAGTGVVALSGARAATGVTVTASLRREGRFNVVHAGGVSGAGGGFGRDNVTSITAVFYEPLAEWAQESASGLQSAAAHKLPIRIFWPD
jgi:hypothetical protein